MVKEQVLINKDSIDCITTVTVIAKVPFREWLNVIFSGAVMITAKTDLMYGEKVKATFKVEPYYEKGKKRYVW